MDFMDGVSVRIIEQANPSDTRGETWAWDVQALQLTICIRKIGSVSCHYHNGDDPSKTPERLFIVRGKVKFTFRCIGIGEQKELITVAGTAISIGPGIVHKTEVIEHVIIIESRIQPFNPSKPDTYPAEI